MTISVTCENCDREIRAKDEAAGKTVRCPGCSEPVRIPTPRVAKPAVRKPKPAAPKPEDGEVDWGKAAMMASNAEGMTKPCPKCGEDIGLKEVKCEFCGHKLTGKKKSQTQSSRSDSGGGTEAWLITVVVLTVIDILCVGIGLAIPGARPVTAVLAGLAGVGITLFGYVWFLKVAAEDGVATLLMCLFIPCYNFYFLCTNLDTAGKPFAVYFYGSFLMSFSVGILLPPEAGLAQ